VRQGTDGAHRYHPWVIDLHCHSTCSDGTDTPEELAAQAAAIGLRAVALTDHDTVDGFARFAARCDEGGVRAIRGAEISCLDEGRSAHVLCYFVADDPDSVLRTLLRTLAGDRERRNELLFERLAELGFDKVTPAEVAEGAGVDVSSIGRPHFADALLRLYPDAFESRQAVFDDFLGVGGSAYINKARVTIAEACAAAAQDGSVAALAHPLITIVPELRGPQRTRAAIAERVGPVLERLAASGLSGVECYYSRHTDDETALLKELAHRHGLVATGGSDYHGANKPDIALGTGLGGLKVPDGIVDELEARRT
jgi:predicted metal-dependent phosphoesterase TrpH